MNRLTPFRRACAYFLTALILCAALHMPFCTDEDCAACFMIRTLSVLVLSLRLRFGALSPSGRFAPGRRTVLSENRKTLFSLKTLLLD